MEVLVKLHIIYQDHQDRPGQVARVVEGRRLVDLLLGLVAALLLHRGLLLLPVPLLRLLMGLGGLGKLLCLVYLDQVRHAVDGRHGGQGDNQQFIIGLDCLQSCSRLEKERPNNRKQRHHPKPVSLSGDVGGQGPSIKGAPQRRRGSPRQRDYLRK